jgi:hypothetical protein
VIRPKRTSKFVVGVGWLFIALLQFLDRGSPNSIVWIGCVLLACAYLYRSFLPQKPSEEVDSDG